MSILGFLINAAKGYDRSLRDYAKACDVDVAILSKMISGKYVPKTPDTYRKLVSKNAAPRNGVTYEMFVEAVMNFYMQKLYRNFMEVS